MLKYSVVYSLVSKIKNGFWRPHLYPTGLFLEVFFKINRNGTIIKIGANDGINDDPTYPYLLTSDWKGILVEPQKYFYDKLVRNLASIANRFIFENVAINEVTGSFNLYTIDTISFPQLPEYCALCSSLNHDQVLNVLSNFGLGQEVIKVESVNTMLLEDLLKKYNIKSIDFLQLDTEGFDGVIIRSIDFSTIKPKVIIFEHVNLNLEEYKEVCAILRKIGYSLYYWDRDTFALDSTQLINVRRPIV